MSIELLGKVQPQPGEIVSSMFTGYYSQSSELCKYVIYEPQTVHCLLFMLLYLQHSIPCCCLSNNIHDCVVNCIGNVGCVLYTTCTQSDSVLFYPFLVYIYDRIKN